MERLKYNFIIMLGLLLTLSIGIPSESSAKAEYHWKAPLCQNNPMPRAECFNPPPELKKKLKRDVANFYPGYGSNPCLSMSYGYSPSPQTRYTPSPCNRQFSGYGQYGGYGQGQGYGQFGGYGQNYPPYANGWRPYPYVVNDYGNGNPYFNAQQDMQIGRYTQQFVTGLFGNSYGSGSSSSGRSSSKGSKSSGSGSWWDFLFKSSSDWGCEEGDCDEGTNVNTDDDSSPEIDRTDRYDRDRYGEDESKKEPKTYTVRTDGADPDDYYEGDPVCGRDDYECEAKKTAAKTDKCTGCDHQAPPTTPSTQIPPEKTVDLDYDKECLKGKNDYIQNKLIKLKIDVDYKLATSDVGRCIFHSLGDVGNATSDSSSTFRICPGAKKTKYRPCLTKEYHHIITKSFTDVTKCLGLTQEEFFPTIALESRYHINRINHSGDSKGITQLVPAASVADMAGVNHGKYKKQMKGCNNQKLISLFKKSNLKKADADNCELLSVDKGKDNPDKSLLYGAVFYKRNKARMTQKLKRVTQKSSGKEPPYQCDLPKKFVNNKKLLNSLTRMSYSMGVNGIMTNLCKYVSALRSKKMIDKFDPNLFSTGSNSMSKLAPNKKVNTYINESKKGVFANDRKGKVSGTQKKNICGEVN